MKTKALALAKKNGFAAEQIRFSDKLEWVEYEGELVLRKARIDRRAKVITLFTEAIEANYPKTFEQHSLEMLDLAIKTLGNGQWDEEEHPRDDDGKFGHGAGSAANAFQELADAANKLAKEQEISLEPEIVDVGGDEWNRETAIRLETEYQTAKPKLEALIHKSVGEEVEGAVADEDELHDNAPYVPDHWDGLSDYQQEEVKSAWKENNKQEFIDHEENSWIDNGGAMDDTKSKIAYEFGSSDPNFDWVLEDINTWKEERREAGEGDIPFDSMDIMNSISMSYDSDGEGTGDLTIEFDDSQLTKPTDPNFNPDQGTLPGIEPLEPHQLFTEEMREELTERLELAFQSKADDDVSDAVPPDYLTEQAEEYMDEYWDGLDDDEKFKHADDIVNQAQQEYDEYYENGGASGESFEVAIPETFDPLQVEGGTDYKKTNALVTFMSRERGIQILQERGLVDADRPTSDFRGDVKDIDNQLWRDWKSSSAGTFGGQILQLASAEELGARYREMPTPRQDLIKQANDRYKEIGGYNGIRALVRAKWETSQYALDKAGIKTLPVYRGLRVQMPEDEPTQNVEVDTYRYEKFTDVAITRNGMYSTTTNVNVANGWNAGSGTKVVLRLDVPRTAVVSFPAYGINVHSEKEVVVAGTAFHGWDAWKNKAPEADFHAIQRSKKAA